MLFFFIILFLKNDFSVKGIDGGSVVLMFTSSMKLENLSSNCGHFSLAEMAVKSRQDFHK